MAPDGIAGNLRFRTGIPPGPQVFPPRVDFWAAGGRASSRETASFGSKIGGPWNALKLPQDGRFRLSGTRASFSVRKAPARVPAAAKATGSCGQARADKFSGVVVE